MPNKKILIIGEVFVDVHLDLMQCRERLGGIFHSARGLCALGVEYYLAYYSPSYLIDAVNRYSVVLSCKGSFQLGDIGNAPCTMLIRDSKEVADQGYINILKDEAKYTEFNSIESILQKSKPTDILIFPGRYDIAQLIKVLERVDARIHIDYHYDYDKLNFGNKISVETAIISTSSTLFQTKCRNSIEELRALAIRLRAAKVLLKENRGGSMLLDIENNEIINMSAQLVNCMHSVGVGDCYNAAFVGLDEENTEYRMKLASFIAAKYSETMSFKRFDEFINKSILYSENVKNLGGVRLSWYDRKKRNIYIAAPDFPDLDTSILDLLGECLTYHNFSPRFPIRENGVVKKTTTLEEKGEIYSKDIRLINDCDMAIAVLLSNDSGTFVELGMFKQAGKPTIILDPYGICDNMFVRFTPDFYCKTIEDTLNATYQCLKERGTL